MVILRANRFGERERHILSELSSRDGVSLAVAMDETAGSVDVSPYAKVSVTRESCQALGLHCPIDFTWRNGDYCLYLSRRNFPDIEHFWMIEADVEHSFPDFWQFMGSFDQFPEIDFLSAHFRLAESDWHWRRTVPSTTKGVFRCFFPLIRISARAIDACLQQRLRDRVSLASRLYWANDEAFVANTVLRAGLKAVDFNSVSAPVYADETFGYIPLDGTEGSFRHAHNHVFHPVLYGDAYEARLARIGGARNTMVDRVGRKLQQLIRAE